MRRHRSGAFANSVKHITIGECGAVGSYAFVDNTNLFAGGPA